jgi:hypothetical protein
VIVAVAPVSVVDGSNGREQKVESLGRLPDLALESAGIRWLWGSIAAVIIVGFFLTMLAYWLPANPGTDQNGYLVGGKMFARTWSTGFKPMNPYEFVGRMWVEVPGGKFFPKYPLGLSVIYAIALKLGGAGHGVWLAMMVNPVAMALALVASFELIRIVVGSFWAVLGTLLLASSPVCIGLTDNPNSHATAICCIAWGMYLLFRWWQVNGLWRAILAGLLIGSAVTIRYTEGMVVAPLVLVVLLNVRRQGRRWWLQPVALLFSWSIPVAILAVYNLVSMHHLTGYDPTNESTGFTWEWFTTNWETMLREMYNTGLFFTLPFALLGGILMFRWNWRVSIVLASWILPNLILYTAYYWAPDGATIGYLRFVLTIFPALILVTVWSMKWMTDLASMGGSPALARIAVGIVIAVGCGVNLYTALGGLDTDLVGNRFAMDSAHAVLKAAPAGSVIFSMEKPLNFIQLIGDYDLYDIQQFDRKTIDKYADIKPDAPTGLQPQRAEEIYKRSKGMNESDLVREQNRLMTDALSQGKRVFMVLPKNQSNYFFRFESRKLFTVKIVDSWEEEADPAAGKKQKWIGFNVQKDKNALIRNVSWEVIEIKAAPPPAPVVHKHLSKTSTKPSTRPVRPKNS